MKNEKYKINGINIGFTDKKITAYGGFSLLALFFEKIGLKEALGKMIPIKEISPNAMKAEEKIYGFLVLLLAGESKTLITPSMMSSI